MSSIFTKIINKEIPCYKIAEDDNFIAFLDVFPIAEGHVLVVPKLEIDKFFDLPTHVLQEMMAFAKPIAMAMQKAIECSRVGVSVIGLEVPHAHMHLVPINGANDLNFTKEKLKLSAERMQEIQQAITLQLLNLD